MADIINKLKAMVNASAKPKNKPSATTPKK